MNALRKIKERIERKFPNWRRTIGIALVLIGFLALITPFTPGSWLALVGLEILGVRILVRTKLRKRPRS